MEYLHKALMRETDPMGSMLVNGYIRIIQHEIDENIIIPIIINDICYYFYKYIQCNGELFDLLYYTTKLKEKVIRTYFVSMVHQIELIHSINNEFIGDLQPQYIFIDNNLEIDIVPYKLSSLSTIYPYTAPEIILSEEIDNMSFKRDIGCKADVFSLGVILFILFCRYPPFEKGSKECKWYKPLIKQKTCKFWKFHSKSCCCLDNDLKDLIQRMYAFNPNQRISIQEIKKHKWFKRNIYNKQCELINVLKKNFIKIEEKRKKDCWDNFEIIGGYYDLTEYKYYDTNNHIEMYPHKQYEGIFDVYTHYKSNKNEIIDTYSTLDGWITDKLHGKCIFHENRNILKCIVATNGINSTQKKEKIEFEIKVYQSLVWKNRKCEYKDISPEGVAFNLNELENVYIVRIIRCNGDPLVFIKVKNYILKHCYKAIKGLPSWSRKLLQFDKENNL